MPRDLCHGIDGTCFYAVTQSAEAGARTAPNALMEDGKQDGAVIRSVAGLVGCVSRMPVTVRLASERSDRLARSSHGVARKRNGINPISGVPTVANPNHTADLKQCVRLAGQADQIVEH